MKTTAIPGFLAAAVFAILARQTDAQLSTIPGSKPRGLEATDKPTDEQASDLESGVGVASEDLSTLMSLSLSMGDPGFLNAVTKGLFRPPNAKAQKAEKGGNSKAWKGSKCSNPIAAILSTLNCIEKANVTCASTGYDSSNFVRLHNDIDTNTIIDESFWQFAFLLLTFDLDINHQMNIGTNQASIRYVETLTSTDGSSFGLPPSSDYPFGQVLLQYEHALVTVDNDCHMIRWDQYGDNKEQKDVDDVATAILCSVGIPGIACT